MLRAFSADSVDSLGATPMSPNWIGQIRPPRASLANENPPEHSGVRIFDFSGVVSLGDFHGMGWARPVRAKKLLIEGG
jgi:hypothetical protein